MVHPYLEEYAVLVTSFHKDTVELRRLQKTQDVIYK